MRKLLEAYIAHLREQEKSKATIAKYTHDITAFFAWLETATRNNATPFPTAKTLTKTHIVAYKQWLIETYAPASVNSMLAALSTFLTFIGRSDCKVRALKIQRSLFYPEEKELSRAEYFRLLDTAHATNKTLWLMMQTLCGAGLRVSELQCVTVESLHTGRVEVTCKGKRRVALLPQTLRKKLLRYTQARRIYKGVVFVTAHGAPVDRSRIWAAMKKLCATARVSAVKVFPHNLRHLFARTYYHVTKDITRLADLLGHSSINTTRIYTLTDGRQQALQIEKLGLIQEKSAT